MITAAIGWITSRKWAMELVIFAVVAGLIWMGCNHLIQVGVEKERAVWTAKMAAQQLENVTKAAHDQGKADAAHEADTAEIARLNDFVAGHPLHGGLCHKPDTVQSNPTAATDGHHESTGTTAAPVQQVSTGDTGGEPDQLGMLSVFARKCDAYAAELREYQAR